MLAGIWWNQVFCALGSAYLLVMLGSISKPHPRAYSKCTCAMYLVSIAAVPNGHKLSGLKGTHLLSQFLWFRNIDNTELVLCTRPKSRCW